MEKINIYSKSESELGRLLSNFAHTPFVSPKGDTFESVEGWWYWYVTGKKHHILKTLWGFRAKEVGKTYERVNTVTPDILKQVYLLKLQYNPKLKEMLLSYDGEFDHYYMYGSKKVVPDSTVWTAKLWEQIRDELNKNTAYN